jgi:hypothetical protein
MEDPILILGSLFNGNTTVVTLCHEYMSFDFCAVCSRLFPKALKCLCAVHDMVTCSYGVRGNIHLNATCVRCDDEMDREVFSYIRFARGCLNHQPSHCINGTYLAGTKIVLQIDLISHTVTIYDAKTVIFRSAYSYHEPKPLKFIHITKTAGTSIEKYGLQHGLAWGRHHAEYGRWHRHRFYRAIWHTLFTLQPKEFKDRFDWFMVVRNPYDRIVSEYYCAYAGSDRPRRVADIDVARKDFNCYVQSKIQSRYACGDHYSEQILYFEPEVVRVLHFENLANEFADLMSEYGLPTVLSVHESPAVRVAGGERFTTKDFSHETVELINSVYEKDFDVFGYQKIKM